MGIVIGYVVVKTGSLWPGVLFHLAHNSLAVLQTRLTTEMHQSQPLLRWLLVRTEEGEFSYSIEATVLLGLVGLGVLWWLRSLPYQRLAEERLQEALDHQPSLPVKASA